MDACVPAAVGMSDSAETEVRRPAEKPGGNVCTLSWEEGADEGGKDDCEGDEVEDEKLLREPSSSMTDESGVESTPKGPLVKSELAAGVLVGAAEPRRAWLSGAAAREDEGPPELLGNEEEPETGEPLKGLPLGRLMKGGACDRDVGDEGATRSEDDEPCASR